MGRSKLSTEAKIMRGTYEASREARASGRIKLTASIDPPAGLSDDAKREWRVHMDLCIQSGTLAISDLRAFQTLAETAAMLQRAMAEAIKTGPVTYGDRGCKPSPAWTIYNATHARYAQLLHAFGLTPRGGHDLPQLPPPRGEPLREVT
jgi:P27 family predicted phage terminase small subunit